MNSIHRTLISGFLATGFACLAFAVVAGEQAQTTEVFKIKTGEGAPLEFRFENEAGLRNLADGETRTVTSTAGDVVGITRNGNQLTIISSDGQSLEVPFVDGGDMKAHTDMVDGQHEKHEVRIMHKAGDDSPHLLILSPGGLTEQEQVAIRQAIESTGINKEVQFVGGEGEGEVAIELEVHK